MRIAPLFYRTHGIGSQTIVELFPPYGLDQTTLSGRRFALSGFYRSFG